MWDDLEMRSPRQSQSKLYSYAVLIVLCLFALSAAVFNGLHRGHWFTFGIFTDAVVCCSMVMLFVAEKRKLKG